MKRRGPANWRATVVDVFSPPSAAITFFDVLITGDYPGDGKPKAVSFPDPRVAIRGEGMMVLPINQLVELKLASGITNPDRLKDLADVQELIRAARLPLELGDELHPMVQPKYAEIWHATKRERDDEY